MNGNRKVIGLIGGLGNEAMVDLALKMSCVSGNTGNAYVVYGNSRLAYKPKEVGCDWADTDEPELRRADTADYTARLMCHLGCSAVGLACNSAHDLFRRVMGNVPAEFVDMIVETAGTFRETGGRVLVLGVTSLVDSGLYQTALEKCGVTALRASAGNQRKIMSAIYDAEFGIKTAKITAEAQSLICEVLCDEYERKKYSHVVLGCTELPLVLTPERFIRFRRDGLIPRSIEVVDASSVLARKLVAAGDTCTSGGEVDMSLGSHTDWFPPAVFQVESLGELADIQSRVISLTAKYLDKRGRRLEGSYMHLPTFFGVGEVPHFAEKVSSLSSNFLAQQNDWEKKIDSILEAHFDSINLK
ncbi:aspartate/glutamate racemase family protein [Maridesulfovibrio sp.]|uniref:aspartate/glutamate racemase family protein n=1 Tax=Maridesulfovibrio sp. TaxID=2795000 RepID=UPI002A18AA09|nr:aspartate/glutamate racemase family protein [Maridesulfovibrio sp.]